MHLKCAINETPYPPLRGPPSPMGKAAIREHRYPHIVRANTCMCEKIIPPTKPSPRGEGGERSEPDRVLAVWKRAGKIVSSASFTRAPYPPLTRSPFPNGEDKEEGGAAPKGSQPRLAALGSPFQGKGLAWTLPPSYGRRCPEGAAVRWGKRYEREREDRLKQTIYERTRAPLCGPPSPMGKAKRRGLRRPQRKPTPPRCARQPLPREGARVDTPSFLWKEVPRRGGGWMGEAG